MLNILKNYIVKTKILFYPEIVNAGYKVFLYSKELGYEITNDVKDNFDIVFFNHVSHKDSLHPKDEIIKELNKSFKTFNIDCNNVRKSHVAKIHKEVFGYNAEPNGTKTIRKSELQSTKQESFTDIIKNDGYHYMRFIDTYDGDRYHTLRVPYFNGNIPIVVDVCRNDILKRNHKTDILKVFNPEECFIMPELDFINQFCNEFGLDYGELDILRDINTGKIYIIDVNDKPGIGMLNESDIIKTVYIQAFKKMINDSR